MSNNETTYAEYMNSFALMFAVKKQLIVLNLPIDEVSSINSMTEEELFLRKWDIDNIALGSNINLSKQWFEKEEKRIIASTIINN
jgi:hypothetical protein